MAGCHRRAGRPDTTTTPAISALRAARGPHSGPGGPVWRVDPVDRAGDEIPAAYDSLIAKLVTWGSDREQAVRRMRRALDDFVIEGMPTTISAHLVMLADESFLAGSHTTATVGELAARFEPAAAPRAEIAGVVVAVSYTHLTLPT